MMSLHLFLLQVDSEDAARGALLERAYSDALALLRIRKVVVKKKKSPFMSHHN